MPIKKTATSNRYSAERSRQRAKGSQQKRPATSTAPAPSQQIVVDRSDLPVQGSTLAATPSTRPSTRPAPATRGKPGTQVRGGRSVPGLHTNWAVVRRDLTRVGIIAGSMIAFLIILSLVLPALRII